MEVLKQATTSDIYTDACSLFEDGATSVKYLVANASVAAQLMPVNPHGGVGIFGPEFPITPEDNTYDGACGIRFRSLVPGFPAQVLAVTFAPGDPSSSGGIPFTSLLNAQGGLTNALIAPTVTLAAFPPSNPQDGQIVSLILPSVFDPVGGRPTRWLCEYDSALAMWHVKGPALYAEVQTSEIPAATGLYVDMATVGPSITIPRQGDYIVSHGAIINDANAATLMSYAIGGTGAVDADFVALTPPGATAIAASIARDREKANLATSIVLTAKYKTAAAGQGIQSRWLSATPLRIS